MEELLIVTTNTGLEERVRASAKRPFFKDFVRGNRLSDCGLAGRLAFRSRLSIKWSTVVVVACMSVGFDGWLAGCVAGGGMEPCPLHMMMDKPPVFGGTITKRRRPPPPTPTYRPVNDGTRVDGGWMAIMVLFLWRHHQPPPATTT